MQINVLGRDFEYVAPLPQWPVFGAWMPSCMAAVCFLWLSSDIRKKEKLLLQKAGYIQSLNNAITTVIPTVATILAFIAHTSLGHELTSTSVSASVPPLLAALVLPCS